MQAFFGKKYGFWGRRLAASIRAMGSQHTGTVKWFNDTKGYGFIVPDRQPGKGNLQDVFVHHTEIQASGYRTLAEGDRVRFELRRGSRGVYAASVQALG